MPNPATILNDEIAVYNVAHMVEVMKKKGYNFTSLAAAVGVSPSTISNIANQKSACTVIIYNAIAPFLDWETYVPGRKIPLHDTAATEPRELTFPFDNDTIQGDILKLVDALNRNSEANLKILDALRAIYRKLELCISFHSKKEGEA